MLGTAQPSAKPTRILITGASGTLGYNTVRRLSTRDRAARITVLMRTPAPALFADLPNVTARVIELFDTDALRRTIEAERPQAIVHCAAGGLRPGDPPWFEMIQLNVTVTLALFEAACDLDECHFVHVSTGLVYRERSRPLVETDALDPNHPYGASKAAADSLLRSGAERLQRRLTIVRPFSFTGPHDHAERLFPSLLRCAQDGRPFEMSAGTQIRDYCAVHDVANAICLILERPTSCGVEVYNVGSGDTTPLRRVVESVCERLALGVDVRFGALAFGPYEPRFLVADTARLRAIGWRPERSLSSAVHELAAARYPGALGSAALAYG